MGSRDNRDGGGGWDNMANKRSRDDMGNRDQRITGDN